jgi:hypothetical protein
MLRWKEEAMMYLFRGGPLAERFIEIPEYVQTVHQPGYNDTGFVHHVYKIQPDATFLHTEERPLTYKSREDDDELPTEATE